jgi:hypothetical protein
MSPCGGDGLTTYRFALRGRCRNRNRQNCFDNDNDNDNDNAQNAS